MCWSQQTRKRGLYHIAASPFYDGSAMYDTSTTTAILQYSGNYTPPSSSWLSIPMPKFPSVNDSGTVFNFTKSLRGLATQDHPTNVPTNVTRQIYMTVSTNELPCQNSNGSCSGPNGARLASSLNNISYQIPHIDILRHTIGIYTFIYNPTISFWACKLKHWTRVIVL